VKAKEVTDYLDMDLVLRNWTRKARGKETDDL
jgi:hypothetical protein